MKASSERHGETWKMYDLIVVGAGTAGCMVAQRTAAQGYKVLLLDRKPLDDLGHTWVNGVERGVFSRVGIPDPPGEETMSSPLSSRLMSP